MDIIRHTGRVVAFDAARGLGEIAGDDGRAWPFHCAVIADGSRHIDTGATVSFETRFHVKREEAFDIRPV